MVKEAKLKVVGPELETCRGTRNQSWEEKRKCFKEGSEPKCPGKENTLPRDVID